MLCQLPWTNVMIQRNGAVRVCCHNSTQMGDLNSETLEEVWHGSEFLELRTRLSVDDFSYGCSECPVVAEARVKDA